MSNSIRNHTFVEFMVRDHGWTREAAKFELENFLLCNGVPVVLGYYLTVFRKGASVLLSRNKRVNVYQTFQNACNHATFS